MSTQKFVTIGLAVILLNLSICLGASDDSDTETIREEQAAGQFFQQEDNQPVQEMNDAQEWEREEQIRDAFFELLTFIELIHDADKISQKIDALFETYKATPYSKIRDFYGARPRISLLRFATHTARLDGQEGKFALLEELLKRGSNPFIVEEGEVISIADENAMTRVRLCNPEKAGFLGIYDYETANEEVKEKARIRHVKLCSNAKRIQTMFKECKSSN